MADGGNRRVRIGAIVGTVIGVAATVAASVIVMAGGAGAFVPNPGWVQLGAGTQPPSRSSPTMASDEGTGQIVLFGGVTQAGTDLGDTWIWQSAQGVWSAGPSTGPSARSLAAMAYDPATGQLVLFGGFNHAGNTTTLGDTWVWNGSAWSQMSPPTSPLARDNAAMAYDGATGQLLLFGGVTVNGTSPGDTWAWNGSTWTQVASSGPPGIISEALAYDDATGQLVAFGGQDNNNNLTGQTWVWNGTAWTQLQPAQSPPARFGSQLAFDPATGQLVLFSGTAIFEGDLPDTWVWTGTTWIQQSPPSSPPGRSGAGFAYDPALRSLLLFGGANASSTFGDMWAWGRPAGEPLDWTARATPTAPSVRSGASMAYDPRRGGVLLFGGVHDPTLMDDTWLWKGSEWVELHPAHRPPPRQGASMAYDPVFGEVILFGGFGSNLQVNDTWAWDGNDWTQLAPSTSPPVRFDAAMGFDPDSGQLVLFGGQSGGQGVLSDTWVWAPCLPLTSPPKGCWTQESPSSSPPKRHGSAMDFDPVHAQLLLFGGIDDSGNSPILYDDTWAWANNTWTQQAGARPPARTHASLAGDPGSGQLVLFSGAPFRNDTWTWAGSSTGWTQLSPATGPPARESAPVAFDPSTGQLVLFGGEGLGVLFNDTWTLGVNENATGSSPATPTSTPAASRASAPAASPVATAVTGRPSFTG